MYNFDHHSLTHVLPVYEIALHLFCRHCEMQDVPDVKCTPLNVKICRAYLNGEVELIMECDAKQAKSVPLGNSQIL